MSLKIKHKNSYRYKMFNLETLCNVPIASLLKVTIINNFVSIKG